MNKEQTEAFVNRQREINREFTMVFGPQAGKESFDHLPLEFQGDSLNALESAVRAWNEFWASEDWDSLHHFSKADYEDVWGHTNQALKEGVVL